MSTNECRTVGGVEKSRPSATLSTTNPTKPDLGSKANELYSILVTRGLRIK